MKNHEEPLNCKVIDRTKITSVNDKVKVNSLQPMKYKSETPEVATKSHQKTASGTQTTASICSYQKTRFLLKQLLDPEAFE